MKELSVNAYSKIENPALKTQALRNEEIIRHPKPKQEGEKCFT